MTKSQTFTNVIAYFSDAILSLDRGIILCYEKNIISIEPLPGVEAAMRKKGLPTVAVDGCSGPKK